ncbi:MAG: S1 RNA-binding domain-containing protein [Patescibacteria group bacterium]
MKYTHIMSEENTLMSTAFADIANPPKISDDIEGKVITLHKSRLFVDLSPFGTGVIYGKEFMIARDIIRKVHAGDLITAKVCGFDTVDGYIELSLKEAKQALIWKEAEQAMVDKTVLDVTIQDANKGGLMIVWQGIHGFLPASQLKPEHYPKVEDGNKDKIQDELKKLIGQKISLSIITADSKEGKLIFSERGIEGGTYSGGSNKGNAAKSAEMSAKYSVGDDVDGVVTGTVDFGVFIKVNDELEGLAHISELDWGLVEDPRILFKVGDAVKARIIDVKDGKVSMSLKARKDNPWKLASAKYKKDDEVTGVIIKFNRHGALASIEEGVSGLVHISEFGNEAKMKEKIDIGKSYTFKINMFEPREQRMTLHLVESK